MDFRMMIKFLLTYFIIQIGNTAPIEIDAVSVKYVIAERKFIFQLDEIYSNGFEQEVLDGSMG